MSRSTTEARSAYAQLETLSVGELLSGINTRITRWRRQSLARSVPLRR